MRNDEGQPAPYLRWGVWRPSAPEVPHQPAVGVQPAHRNVDPAQNGMQSTDGNIPVAPNGRFNDEGAQRLTGKPILTLGPGLPQRPSRLNLEIDHMMCLPGPDEPAAQAL
jgi:hypothetical protein